VHFGQLQSRQACADSQQSKARTFFTQANGQPAIGGSPEKINDRNPRVLPRTRNAS